MLSKRGKANGKATAKKVPRAARANQKSKPKSSRARTPRTGMGPRKRKENLSAPLATGQVIRDFRGFSFGAAPPHDEYPEGGLRITGLQPGGAGSASLGQGTAGVALFNTGGVFTPSVLINPCGAVTTNSYALFSGSSPLALFAQYFRKFRFRRLVAEMDSMVTPNGYLGGNGGATILGSPVIQVSLEPDAWTCDSNSPTIDQAARNVNTVRYNAWANDVKCTLINNAKASRDDELFYTTAAADTVTAQASILRQTFQGGIFAVANVAGTLATQQLAKVVFAYVLDLYGFTNYAIAGLPMILSPVREGCLPLPHALKALEERDQKERCRLLALTSTVSDRGDYKRPFQQDRDDLVEFIDLTPRSERLRIRPEMYVEPRAPPSTTTSAKVSSKK